jgi:hypothetical protein
VWGQHERVWRVRRRVREAARVVHHSLTGAVHDVRGSEGLEATGGVQRRVARLRQQSDGVDGHTHAADSATTAITSTTTTTSTTDSSSTTTRHLQRHLTQEVLQQPACDATTPAQCRGRETATAKSKHASEVESRLAK